jgi:PAP2 superfamily
MSATATTPTDHAGRPRAVREVLLMTALFLLYRQVRYLTRNDTHAATANARRVVGFERSLGVFTERALQDVAMNSETVVAFLNRYYVTVHFPLTTAFVVWVLVRHPRWYRQIRTWFVAVTASALAIHVAFPLAPPRMLSREGFVDTLQRFGPSIYTTDTNRSMANQFAAMPSLHFGWAVMVAAGFVAIKRSRYSLIAFVHPLITLLAIVATANHYWLDAAVAFALVAGFAQVILARRSHHTDPIDRLHRSQPMEDHHAHDNHGGSGIAAPPDRVHRPLRDGLDRRPDHALASSLR